MNNPSWNELDHDYDCDIIEHDFDDEDEDDEDEEIEDDFDDCCPSCSGGGCNYCLCVSW